jgi:hypothetical protein
MIVTDCHKWVRWEEWKNVMIMAATNAVSTSHREHVDENSERERNFKLSRVWASVVIERKGIEFLPVRTFHFAAGTMYTTLISSPSYISSSPRDGSVFGWHDVECGLGRKDCSDWRWR